MSYKIYKEGAFIIIEDTAKNTVNEYNSQFVEIRKYSVNETRYDVLYNGLNVLTSVFLADIKTKAGSAYTSSAFDIVRYEETGKIN
jgi:hypothetical protein